MILPAYLSATILNGAYLTRVLLCAFYIKGDWTDRNGGSSDIISIAFIYLLIFLNGVYLYNLFLGQLEGSLKT